MTAELLSSKTVIQEEQAEVRTILGIPTSNLSMVGIAERGPVGEAIMSTSFAEWKRSFGSDIVEGVACSAVRGFYQNGGNTLFFTRTVHYDDVSVPASKTSEHATLDLNTAATSPSPGAVLGIIAAPWTLSPGEDLDIAVDGVAPVTATFDAAPAGVTAGGAAPYALVDGQTLTVKIDGSATVQTAIFNASEFVNIAAATAAEVAAVLNAELTGCHTILDAGKPRIVSDLIGKASWVEVTGGTGNGVLAFSTTPVQGTGDVDDITAVTFAEAKAVIEADLSSTVLCTSVGGYLRIATVSLPPATSSVQIAASSTADDNFGLDNATHSGSTGTPVATLRVDGKTDGTYANDIRILVKAATSGIASELNASVEDNGVYVESFPNVTMDSTSARYVETVINDASTGSRLISVTDLHAFADPLLARPANSPGTPPVPFGPLTGGDDGLAGITDVDFIGDDLGKTGIRSFDRIQDIGLLAIPDRPTVAVQNAMITYGEVERNLSILSILDPPEGLDALGIVDYVVDNGFENLSEFGAIYWPQIKVTNPNSRVFGTAAEIVVPPSGHLAGMFARTDGARVGGVYDPPAGEERGQLRGATGFETDEVLEEARRDLVYPHRINPIQKPPGASIIADGSRTLKGTSNFPSVSERRGVIFIEQSVKRGTGWVRQSNNDAALRARVDRSVTTFLVNQMKVGAFRSMEPDKAFFVDVSEAINPVSAVFAGKLYGRVGLATQKPTDFVIFGFSQDTRALDEELAAAGVGV